MASLSSDAYSSERPDVCLSRIASARKAIASLLIALMFEIRSAIGKSPSLLSFTKEKGVCPVFWSCSFVRSQVNGSLSPRSCISALEEALTPAKAPSFTTTSRMIEPPSWRSVPEMGVRRRFSLGISIFLLIR